MESKKIVSSFLIKYDLSNRVMAKLLDLNPSSINNWRRGAQDISSKNVEHLNKVSKILDALIEESGMNTDALISLMLALKETPLWKGWDTAREFFLGKNSHSKRGALFEDIVKNNLDQITEGLKISSLSEQQSYFDFIAETREGKILAIETKTIEVTESHLGMIITQRNKLYKMIEKDFEVMIIAPSFSQNFLEAIETVSFPILTRTFKFSLF